MEKIVILNRKNQKLSAFIHKPTKQTNKIIIFAHSFKGDKDSDYIAVDFAKHISNKGYALIRFDCFGTGESEGNFEDSSIITQIEDLQDVIKYAKSLGYLDICLIGLSMGTSVSIMAYDNSIKCVILWSPVFSHLSLFERYREEVYTKGRAIDGSYITKKKFIIGKKMLDSFKDIEISSNLAKIRCPLLAIIGSEDRNISEKRAQEFMKMIPSGNKLEVIQGGDHDFLIKKAKKKVIELSADFIKAHL